MYTSGSTGVPKGVEVQHGSIKGVVGGIDYARLGPDRTLLHAAPLAFDASTFELWGALLNGGRCAIHPEQVPTARGVGASIRRHGVTTAFLTTALFNALVDEEPAQLAGLEELLTGGGGISVPHGRGGGGAGWRAGPSTGPSSAPRGSSPTRSARGPGRGCTAPATGCAGCRTARSSSGAASTTR